MKKFTVYIPVIYTEIYKNVEAESKKDAYEKVRAGGLQRTVEFVTGQETEGVRIIEQERYLQTKRKKV